MGIVRPGGFSRPVLSERCGDGGLTTRDESKHSCGLIRATWTSSCACRRSARSCGGRASSTCQIAVRAWRSSPEACGLTATAGLVDDVIDRPRSTILHVGELAARGFEPQATTWVGDGTLDESRRLVAWAEDNRNHFTQDRPLPTEWLGTSVTDNAMIDRSKAGSAFDDAGGLVVAVRQSGEESRTASTIPSSKPDASRPAVATGDLESQPTRERDRCARPARRARLHGVVASTALRRSTRGCGG